MIKKCKVCDALFNTYPSKVKSGRGKYCSRRCSDSITLIKKGQRLSPDTEIKKGDKLRLGKYGAKPWNYIGHTVNDQGYRLVHSPDHPNKDKDGCVREHRLVVERCIGRYLNKEEVVHHINEDRLDNRPENLICFSNNVSHLRHHKGLPYPQEDIVFEGGEFSIPRDKH